MPLECDVQFESMRLCVVGGQLIEINFCNTEPLGANGIDAITDHLAPQLVRLNLNIGSCFAPLSAKHNDDGAAQRAVVALLAQCTNLEECVVRTDAIWEWYQPLYPTFLWNQREDLLVHVQATKVGPRLKFVLQSWSPE